jgi:hypothetical protein
MLFLERGASGDILQKHLQVQILVYVHFGVWQRRVL